MLRMSVCRAFVFWFAFPVEDKKRTAWAGHLKNHISFIVVGWPSGYADLSVMAAILWRPQLLTNWQGLETILQWYMPPVPFVVRLFIFLSFGFSVYGRVIWMGSYGQTRAYSNMRVPKSGQTWKNLNRPLQIVAPGYKHHLDQKMLPARGSAKKMGILPFSLGKWAFGEWSRPFPFQTDRVDINQGGY